MITLVDGYFLPPLTCVYGYKFVPSGSEVGRGQVYSATKHGNRLFSYDDLDNAEVAAKEELAKMLASLGINQ